MSEVKTRYLVNYGLSYENEATLKTVLNGKHNEFDQDAIQKVSPHRDQMIGKLLGLNYQGRFWQVQMGFGIRLENSNSLLQYYKTKDNKEYVEVATLEDDRWSKSYINRTDDETILISTVTIDSETFHSIVDERARLLHMDMGLYDESIAHAKDYKRTVTQTEVKDEQMISLFNKLIAEPQKFNQKQTNK